MRTSFRKRPLLNRIAIIVGLVAAVLAVSFAAWKGWEWYTGKDTDNPAPAASATPTVAPSEPSQTTPTDAGAGIPATASSVALSQSSSPAARARSPYKGFWYGLASQEDLVKLIDDAYARDPSGLKKISETKCAADGSCASLMNFLEAFRAYDPNSGLTSVADLPAYVRKLVLDCTIKGRFMMADIYLPRLSGMGVTETNRMSRFIKDNECVLKNPDTGRPVVALWCGNPVGKQVAPPPCYIIEFDYRRQGDVVPVNDGASVSGHYSLTYAELQELLADECTFVSDANGKRKPALGPCKVNCPPGGGWPPDALAAAVGLPRDRLPNGEPHGQINFTLKKGRGYLSLPVSWLPKLRTSVYCVLVDAYAVRADGFEGWSAVSRFDTVYRTELVRTKAAGKLDRTLKGGSSY